MKCPKCNNEIYHRKYITGLPFGLPIVILIRHCKTCGYKKITKSELNLDIKSSVIVLDEKDEKILKEFKEGIVYNFEDNGEQTK